MHCIRMLYISFLWFCLRIGSTNIISRGFDLVEKGESGTPNKEIAEFERMLKSRIKSLENKPLSP
jgi:hypothetical protein